MFGERSGESDAVSAATVFPLYFGIATEAQAHTVAATLRRELLEPGGLGTTRRVSGEQWDPPNGWAPLQWLAIAGLNAYGERELAREIARRWIRKNIEAYEASGDCSRIRSGNLAEPARRGRRGGEYPLQVGFGWTNGVLAKLIATYPKETGEASAAAPPRAVARRG